MFQPQPAGGSWPPPGHPSNGRRTWWWIGGALVLTVLLVGAGVTFVLTRSDPSGSPVWNANRERPAARSFPAEPKPDWFVKVKDVERIADVDLDGMSWGTGSKDYGNVLLATVDRYNQEDRAQLVAIDTTSGEIMWATPSGGHGAYECATESIGDFIICNNRLDKSTDRSSYLGPHELRYYRIDTGELDHTETIDHQSALEVAGGDVYTAGLDGDEWWVAKGTADDLTASWRVSYPLGGCPEPAYGGWITVENGILQTENLVLDAGTGESLAPASTFAAPLDPDASMLATTPCSGDDGSTRRRREWTVVDRSGKEQWSHTDVSRGWFVSSDEHDTEHYYVGNGAYDRRTGERLWQLGDGMEIRRVFDGALLAIDEGPTSDYDDDSTVGIDPETGATLWRLDDSDYCDVDDSQRCVSFFYTSSDDSRSGRTEYEVRAYDVVTGDVAWKFDTDEYGDVASAGDGFVYVDDDDDSDARITFYPPS